MMLRHAVTAASTCYTTSRTAQQRSPARSIIRHVQSYYTNDNILIKNNSISTNLFHHHHNHRHHCNWNDYSTTRCRWISTSIGDAMTRPQSPTSNHEDVPYHVVHPLIVKAIDTIQHDIIGTDAGQRGMKSLIVPGDLLKAAQCLAFLQPPRTATTATGSKVVILSGFPCCTLESPPTETDGPPGTLALARTAYALGHEVVVVTDSCNQAVFEAALTNLALPNTTTTTRVSFTKSKLPPPPPSLQVFPSTYWNDNEEERLMQLIKDCSLLMACERAGPGKDGNCYTMRGINMSEMGLIAPLHRLATERNQETRTTTMTKFLAIGDGGNELGMGKVFSKILENPQIVNGDQIGCIISADYLIAGSVSNWGGYALAAATALIQADAIVKTKKSNRSNIEDVVDDGIHHGKIDTKLVEQWLNWCLPTEDEEVELLNRCVAAGCRDGVSGKMEATVDGMTLERSLQCLRDIRSTAIHVLAV